MAFLCPWCGSPATVRGQRWECGWCGDSGALAALGPAVTAAAEPAPALPAELERGLAWIREGMEARLGPGAGETPAWALAAFAAARALLPAARRTAEARSRVEALFCACPVCAPAEILAGAAAGTPVFDPAFRLTPEALGGFWRARLLPQLPPYDQDSLWPAWLYLLLDGMEALETGLTGTADGVRRRADEAALERWWQKEKEERP